MGYTTAQTIADELSLEAGLAYHLQGNHYPPVPVAMVQPCIDAIDAYYEEDFDREINLPEGISWRGQTSCPASAIVDTYKVGDLFTTLKSKKTGVIKEIIPNASGSVRVLLEMPTKETRWTTVSNSALV